MLPDINVWLAMAFEAHAHHVIAAEWFERTTRLHWCRYTQLGFLRLATNPSVFRDEALTLKKAWAVFDELSKDDRVEFLMEPRGIELTWRTYTSRKAYSPKVWNDAYLAAFAKSRHLTVVTFDSGIRSFPGASVKVLSNQR